MADKSAASLASDMETIGLSYRAPFLVEESNGDFVTVPDKSLPLNTCAIDATGLDQFSALVVTLSQKSARQSWVLPIKTGAVTSTFEVTDPALQAVLAKIPNASWRGVQKSYFIQADDVALSVALQ